MSQWTFVIAAYAVAGAGTLGATVAAWRAMRAAEAAAEALRRR